MRVYLRDGSAQTILRAATLRQKLQIQLSISPSHSILTPGRPVPALTLERDSTPKKSRRKRDSNPGPSALEADALTTRPTRRSTGRRAHGPFREVRCHLELILKLKLTVCCQGSHWSGKFNPVWTPLLQLTQLCGLCRVEETTAKVAYYGRVLPITEVTMQFLFLPRKK